MSRLVAARDLKPGMRADMTCVAVFDDPLVDIAHAEQLKEVCEQ